MRIDLLCEAAYQDIYAHMMEDLPNEAVGFILNDGLVVRLVNQARSPNRFVISSRLLEEIMGDERPEVFYHTHPGGSVELSSEDSASFQGMTAALVEGGVEPIPWLVVAVPPPGKMHLMSLYYTDGTVAHWDRELEHA